MNTYIHTYIFFTRTLRASYLFYFFIHEPCALLIKGAGGTLRILYTHIHTRTHKHTHTHTHTHTHRQTDRKTDRQTDRQTDTHTHTHTPTERPVSGQHV